jgi:hypothetical protein
MPSIDQNLPASPSLKTLATFVGGVWIVCTMIGGLRRNFPQQEERLLNSMSVSIDDMTGHFKQRCEHGERALTPSD